MVNDLFYQTAIARFVFAAVVAPRPADRSLRSPHESITERFPFRKNNIFSVRIGRGPRRSVRYFLGRTVHRSNV
jgi:hypothetical protein